jgi:carbamoyltransferase
MPKKIVVGLNMSHDGSCAIVEDGEVTIAIEMERLNRCRYNLGRDHGMVPFRAIRYCLGERGIDPQRVDLWVSSSTSPLTIHLTREQLIGIPAERVIDVRPPGHHLAHAWFAYHCSPFEDAAVLVLDTNGGIEWTTGAAWKAENYSIYRGRAHRLEEVTKDYLQPGELGAGEMYMLYSALLQLTPTENGDYGRDHSLSAGGKLMGYAAQDLGRTKAPPLVSGRGDHVVIRIRDAMKRVRRLGLMAAEDPRAPYDRISGREIRRYALFARRTTSLRADRYVRLGGEAQKVLEKVILRIAEKAYRKTGMTDLCLTGGNLLNVIACTEILRTLPFKNVFIPPAPNDSGNAIGAALYGYHEVLRERGRPYTTRPFSAFLGRRYRSAEIALALKALPKAEFRVRRLSEDGQAQALLTHVVDDSVVSVFKGRSEFGPRGLGNRSFLASATRRSMVQRLNRLKGREWYRPVAPIVLEEDLARYFDAPFIRAPFMNLAAACKDETKRRLPAIVHVDGSARIQTVSRHDQPFLHRLLCAYRKKTGLGVLINTSFNLRGEPIVETPAQAVATFMSADTISCLLLEDHLVERTSR